MVADPASDTIGVSVGVTTGTDCAEPDSALGEMSMSISPSGSVWCVSGRCLGMKVFGYAGCHSLEQIQQSWQKKIENCRTRSVPASYGCKQVS